MSDLIELSLPGAETVVAWFGSWPSFHDCEVISVFLARSGSSLVRVYPYYPERPATVVFSLEEVTDVELADFSSQNVIFELRIGTVVDQCGNSAYRLNLDPCYGIAGWIDAKRIHVALEPGKSPDGVSLW